MFTAESIKLLAKPARAAHGYRSRYSDQNIDAQICETAPPPPIAEDPNDSPDPDDRAALQVQQSNDDVTSSDSITPPPPLPTMPCSWWIRITLDPPDTPVSVEDAETCLSLVRARLKATDGRQAQQDAATACLGPREGGDCGQGVANALPRGPEEEIAAASTANLWNEKLDFPATVGQLHEAIEALGPNAWSVFVCCWQTACGIPAPPENRPLGRRFQPSTPLHEASSQADPASPVDHSLEALCAISPSPRPDAAQLEPGLLWALPGMPDRVAGFLRHQPRDPAPWVYRESAHEKAERQALEDIGGWVGG
jgi:hypothetical protein